MHLANDAEAAVTVSWSFVWKTGGPGWKLSWTRVWVPGRSSVEVCCDERFLFLNRDRCGARCQTRDEVWLDHNKKNRLRRSSSLALQLWSLIFALLYSRAPPASIVMQVGTLKRSLKVHCHAIQWYFVDFLRQKNGAGPTEAAPDQTNRGAGLVKIQASRSRDSACGNGSNNLPKEADYRFCVKLRQRQARNLLRDAHCSERVNKQVVQFHLSLLEKETCSDWKRFRKGSWSSGFRSSWRNNPVVWSLSLDFQRSLQNVGRRRRLHLLLS